MKPEQLTLTEWAREAERKNTIGWLLVLWFGGVPVNVGMWYLFDAVFPHVSFFGVVAFIWGLLITAGWFVYSIVRVFQWVADR